MNKMLAVLLIFCLLGGAAVAATDEAKHLLTEFDITFWQTLPFAVFWGYLLDSQLTAGAVNWPLVGAAAVAVAAGNAYVHARRVTR